MEIVFLIIEILLLLCCAAFFSGAETAITAITSAEYRSLKRSAKKNAQRLARLVEIKEKIVIVALIGTNFVNTFSSGLITAFTLTVFGAYAVPIATVIITVLIIILAEIFPKAIATERALAFGKTAALPLFICHILLRPVSVFFSWLSKSAAALFSLTTVEPPAVLHKKDLQLLVHIGKKDGALKAGEEVLLHNAILLQNVKLRDIVTPRANLVSVTIRDDFETLMTKFRTSCFSCLPVYNEDNTSINGILQYNDILFAMDKQKKDSFTDIIRPALFIPEHVSLFSGIKMMNTHKQQIAIVIDEYGGITGLVTMDDITSAVFSRAGK